MKKHAYLIMAHGNWNILEKLLLLLDDERNDIYLHIDAKVKCDISRFESLLKFSKLNVLNSTNVYWADYSIVQCELNLLKVANDCGDYSYYHLLSGVDLPLKSNNEIFDFFEKRKKEFIGIVPTETYYSVRRVKFYHLFTCLKCYRNSKLLKGIDRIIEYGQKLCRVNRLKNSNWRIIDGWQWFSITERYCKYLLANEALIKRVFSKTISCDELVLQTLAYNSSFYDSLYDVTDLKNGSMRFVDWERGKPYTWGGAV